MEEMKVYREVKKKYNTVFQSNPEKKKKISENLFLHWKKLLWIHLKHIKYKLLQIRKISVFAPRIFSHFERLKINFLSLSNFFVKIFRQKKSDKENPKASEIALAIATPGTPSSK